MSRQSTADLVQLNEARIQKCEDALALLFASYALLCTFCFYAPKALDMFESKILHWPVPPASNVLSLVSLAFGALLVSPLMASVTRPLLHKRQQAKEELRALRR